MLHIHRRQTVFATALAGIAIAAFSGIVLAGHLPTHGAVVHFDPNAAGVFFARPAAPLALGFADALIAPLEPWHWETEFRNPGGAAIVLPIILSCPVGPPVAGFLGLGAGVAVTFDIHCADVPEIGAWVWSLVDAGVPVYDLDVSVTEEDPGVPEQIPPELTPEDPNVIEALDHVALTYVPGNPVPALSNWGVGATVALLVMASHFARRRMRTR